MNAQNRHNYNLIQCNTVLYNNKPGIFYHKEKLIAPIYGERSLFVILSHRSISRGGDGAH